MNIEQILTKYGAIPTDWRNCMQELDEYYKPEETLVAKKESDNKLKWDSFLWRALNRVNIRWQENKSKYPVHNHLLPLSRTELEDALFRHYLQLKNDDKSEDHLSAIVLNAMMIMEAEINNSLIEDGLRTYSNKTEDKPYYYSIKDSTGEERIFYPAATCKSLFILDNRNDKNGLIATNTEDNLIKLGGVKHYYE